MKQLDMTNVKEADDFTRPEAGAYICIITKVEDVSAKEYLKVAHYRAVLCFYDEIQLHRTFVGVDINV